MTAIPTVDISLASRACDAESVPGILEKLASFGKSPSVDRDDTRLEVLAIARALVLALETPRETMIKHNWAQVSSTGGYNSCFIADPGLNH